MMRALTSVREVNNLPQYGPGGHNSHSENPDMTGPSDTIYLCNFRVSVDGDWLCLKELHDMDNMLESYIRPPESGTVISPNDPMHSLMGNFRILTTYLPID